MSLYFFVRVLLVYKIFYLLRREGTGAILCVWKGMANGCKLGKERLIFALSDCLQFPCS